MAELEEQIRRKPVRSLELICQIEVIQILHRKAADLESGYMTKWCLDELTNSNRQTERNLDLRSLVDIVDTATVVADFNRKVDAKKASSDARMTVKIKRLKSPPSRQGLRSSKRLKPYDKPEDIPGTHIINALNNLKRQHNLRKSHGIPKGVSAQEYIRFRKCKLVEDIKTVRTYLCSVLNHGVLNGLMDTLLNIMEYNHHHQVETGFLVLESILTTPLTSYLSLHHKLWKATSPSSNIRHRQHQPASMETRIETTLVHFALTSAIRLTHVQISGCACDSLLHMISEVCAGLKFIDFSDSFVSDWAFYHLAGLTEAAPRSQRLTRQCKKRLADVDQDTLDLVQTRRGCRQLTHIVANNLLSIRWPPTKCGASKTMSAYLLNTHGATDYMAASWVGFPWGCGFVEALRYLPKLRVFLTEIGGRAIETLVKNTCFNESKSAKRARKAAPVLPNMQVISEASMSVAKMEVILKVCPNLKSIRAKSDKSTKCNWLEILGKSRHKLEEISVYDSDFRSPKITNYMLTPKTGLKLTSLDLRELVFFKLSWLAAIKRNMSGLRRLTLGITTRNLITSIQMIDIEKDFNIKNGEGKDDPLLSDLEYFHLSGPFGPEVVTYILKGAYDVENIALVIDWLDPTFCSTQPGSDKDLLSVPYLREIRAVNGLHKLTELHLSARYRRGRVKLDRLCADFVLKSFPKLTHLGSFRYWNLSKGDRKAIIQESRLENRNITFDEELRCGGGSGSIMDQTSQLPFQRRYVENRQSLSCNNPLSSVSPQYNDNNNGLLTDFFEVLAGLQGFFNDIDDVQSDSDEDSMMDEDSEDDLDDLDEDDEQDFVLGDNDDFHFFNL